MEPHLAPDVAAYARREVARVGARAVGIVVVYFVLPFEDSWLLTSLLVILVIVGFFPFAFRRFWRILESEHPATDALDGLVISLVALLISFSTAYYTFESRDASSMAGLSTKLDALYFETTVISTVGFGDITAVSQGARAVVTLNIVMNLIFLGATLRLMGWAVKQRRQGRPEPPTRE